jgi:hypothetical protein
MKKKLNIYLKKRKNRILKAWKRKNWLYYGGNGKEVLKWGLEIKFGWEGDI